METAQKFASATVRTAMHPTRQSLTNLGKSVQRSMGHFKGKQTPSSAADINSSKEKENINNDTVKQGSEEVPNEEPPKDTDTVEKGIYPTPNIANTVVSLSDVVKEFN